MIDDKLMADIVKAAALALIVLLLCYILRGTDWQREQSVFTELNEQVSQTND